jgi:adenine phosphoribosyltransferase
VRGEDLAARLRESFAWREGEYADMSGWWGDAALLSELGPALAALHADADVTTVLGVATRGFLLGPLVATYLGVGFVEVRKDRKYEDRHGRGILRRTTPPDYVDRGLTLSISHDALAPRDRVLLVDDWVVTGAQGEAVLRLVEDAGARWLGMAVLVDDTTAAQRRVLNVKSVLVRAQLGG